MPIKKLLVANRGEIAVRIFRSARDLGYETVAVFSDADATAAHVTHADQAVRLGPAAAGESYLNVDRVLAAARRAGADAVHPGYGFLAENAAFARQVIAAGLTWVGPPPAAIETMGNKAAARRALAGTGVACVQGYAGGDRTDAALIKAAASIGYPVMVKAAAGGGGRGMRLVERADALPAALAAGRSEARQAFGSSELILEKAIVNPRHVEIQVFGDRHGNIIHLGERDCSIQRRYQKVIEESPSPVVTLDLRERMGRAAVAVARAVGYYGAGTVEFLLDEAEHFYFIEMNTRLQVEHPVTEMVMGVDLVAWQLLVAEGTPLPLEQAEVELRGHAIEARLYAEDPDNDFLPSAGRVHLWRAPEGVGIRVDHGIESGTVISPYYDAMVAKIVAWGETRELARRRLRRALKQTVVLGVKTNRRFLLETADHPIFVAGTATTGFMDEMWHPGARPAESAVSPRLEALAALLSYRRRQAETATTAALREWRSQPSTFSFDAADTVRTVTVSAESFNEYLIQTKRAKFHIRSLSQTEDSLYFEHDGLQDTIWYVFGADGQLWIQHELETAYLIDVSFVPPANADASKSGRLKAPMPGAVIGIAVKVGDRVVRGQTLLVLEAMKMQHIISAPFDGLIERILVSHGQQMKTNELMVVVSKPSQG